ncbi:MAG: GntR family transcriptional regulator [Candidatus Caldatribacteriota bacterium]|nr:GntR family transcriptional regulator [Candidatus Caldatribacteriota bacterium]
MSRLQIGKIKKDREYLRSLVLKKLQQAIYANKIKFGESITEREIVKEFGVSRTPVREALCMLTTTGLIKFIPEKGFVVGKWTVKEIENAMETRIVLEEFALRLAIRRITHKEIEKLNILLVKMKRTLVDKDVLKFISISNQFHDQIILASKNKEIFNFIQLLKNRIYHFQILMLSNHHNLKKAYNENEEILDSIMKKDNEKTKRLIMKSIYRVNSLIVKTRKK